MIELFPYLFCCLDLTQPATKDLYHSSTVLCLSLHKRCKVMNYLM